MLKVLTEGCEPKRATKFSAAIDLFAAEDVVIGAGETCKVPLGVCISDDSKWLYKNYLENGFDMDFKSFQLEFLQSHYLQLEPRSSLRAKGLIAGTGVVDLDFKNEVMIIIHNPITGFNDKKEPTCICSSNATSYRINKGEKIAQIMLCEHKSYLMGYESETERVGGFGSTN